MKCKTLLRINTNAKNFITAIFCIFFTSTLIAQTITPQNHKTGAVLLSKSAYASLPLPNWDTLTRYAPNPPSSGIATPENGITLLSNPPVGDQQTEGSCVAWAVGYSALGILMYPKYNCWNVAERSPSFIFNQIKIGGNCTTGSNTTDALNLVETQGDCSINLMPYVNGDCMTQPNAAQSTEAAQNKALNWVRLNTTDYSSMKAALDLGYPIVIAFEVYQSFYDMFNTATAVWNTNYGTDFGGHATCIIGYNNITGMFKVQNQWGTAGGDHGFFYIPYTFIQSGCLSEAYILYATNPLTPMSINGPSNVCTPSQYTVNNLPTGSTVVWSIDNNSIATVSTTGLVSRVMDGTVTLTATITNCGGTNPIVISQPLAVGNVLTGTITQSGNNTPLYTTNSISAGPTSVTFQWPGVTGISCYQSSSNPPVSQTGFIYYPSQSKFWFTLASGQSITVSFSGTGCGGTTIATRSFHVGGYYYVISPNPASGSINVAPISESNNLKTANSLTGTTATVSITDVNGGLKKQQQFSSTSTNMKLNVSGLTPGTYFVHIINGTINETHQVIIK